MAASGARAPKSIRANDGRVSEEPLPIGLRGLEWRAQQRADDALAGVYRERAIQRAGAIERDPKAALN